MAAKEFIVAIELGSSKITGIAVKKSMDGSIQVLAVVREDATSCIRKGVVFNIDKTSICLTNIIKRLKTMLKSEISRVYVGMGGQSIRSIRNTIVKTLPEDSVVTQDIINELMDNNRSMQYPDLEILDAATQEYKVGTQLLTEPVGVQCNKLEGNFLNILCRKAFFRNLNKCFENANITIAELYLAPIALAHSVLTEVEKRTGSLLVDLGADTTTVSVYYKNILRHLAVIPLGSNNITKDLATELQVEEKDAETMKLNYAQAFTDTNEIEEDKKYRIDDERSVAQQKFVDIVEGRVNEIIQNVWYQVPSEYKNKLMGGIVLTGGGSNMKKIKEAFTNITEVGKIRIANTVTQNVTSTDKDVNAHNGMMNTALGLLAKGDLNCAGQPITKTDLFSEPAAATPATDTGKTFRNPGETKPGQVLTAKEKEAIEEDRRRKLEEERRKAELEDELRQQRERENEGKSFFDKIKKSGKDFFSKLISEENTDDDTK